MKSALLAFCVCLSFAAPSSRAETRTICTLAVSATSGDTLVSEGNCWQRMSPASTFKIAISLMGFDAGVLKSPTEPELPFKEGYIDARPEWRRPATPASWMRDSVIWYSQQVAQRLGMQRYSAYVAAFDYGNNDLSGERARITA